MSIRQRLELRQTQQLVMTPQLRQAIRMLQMSSLELSAFLAEEAERNPLIDLDGAAVEPRAEPSAGERAAVDADIRRADLAAGEAQLEAAPENLYEAPDGPPRSIRRDEAPATPDGETPVAQSLSLSQHVSAQIALARLSPEVRLAAEMLAGDLDEAGYLRIDPDEAARRLGAPRSIVDAAIAAIRDCEPTGVGARDLADCLALQLAERDRLDPAMRALLADLAALPNAPRALIAARCGVDLDDLSDMLAELRSLDPRPGLQIGGGVAEPVVPDVLVRPDGAGGWRVEANPDATPRLLVDRGYVARIGPACAKARLFLAECAQTASWLEKSLDQRMRTIVSVAAEIVRQQAAFLDRGMAGLRPMTLRAVAEAVGVHESTVSRVTSSKFMATPRGLFELKFFFTNAIAAVDGGAAHSAESVRARIRALVGAECPARPLSDDVIVRMLKAEGMDLARRTVAKYRESMNIPSSVDRRRRAAAAV